MIRLLVAAFVIAHGLIHVAIYATPSNPDKAAPFNPTQSWLLLRTHVAASSSRRTVISLAWVIAVAYALAAVAQLLDAAPWKTAVAAAALVAILLKVVWFNPWLIVGLALDLGVLTAAATGWPGSLMG